MLLTHPHVLSMCTYNFIKIIGIVTTYTPSFNMKLGPSQPINHVKELISVSDSLFLKVWPVLISKVLISYTKVKKGNALKNCS